MKHDFVLNTSILIYITFVHLDIIKYNKENQEQDKSVFVVF